MTFPCLYWCQSQSIKSLVKVGKTKNPELRIKCHAQWVPNAIVRIYPVTCHSQRETELLRELRSRGWLLDKTHERLSESLTDDQHGEIQGMMLKFTLEDTGNMRIIECTMKNLSEAISVFKQRSTLGIVPDWQTLVLLELLRDEDTPENIKDIAELVRILPDSWADNSDTWHNVAFALISCKDELAYDIFDEFSRRSSKFKHRDMMKFFAINSTKSREGKITYRSLYECARFSNPKAFAQYYQSLICEEDNVGSGTELIVHTSVSDEVQESIETNNEYHLMFLQQYNWPFVGDKYLPLLNTKVYADYQAWCKSLNYEPNADIRWFIRKCGGLLDSKKSNSKTYWIRTGTPKVDRCTI